MIELECGTPINHLSIEWVNLSEYGMHERFGSRVLTLSLVWYARKSKFTCSYA